MTWYFKVKKLCNMLSLVIFISCALVDRKYSRLPVAWFVSFLYKFSFNSPVMLHFYSPFLLYQTLLRYILGKIYLHLLQYLIHLLHTHHHLLHLHTHLRTHHLLHRLLHLLNPHYVLQLLLQL